jgi:hypothetical protein
MRYTAKMALATPRNKDRRRFPKRSDSRVRDGMLFPFIEPKFQIDPARSVFTIGSCFARNIEEKLSGITLPTRSFRVPKSEWPARPNGLLNEYNPGTMFQRVDAAARGVGFGDLCVAEDSGGFADLFMVGTAAPVSRERLLERRAEVDAVYAALPVAGSVIITLGLIEAWFDNETGLYLNRMPPDVREAGSRYEFRVMDYKESFPLLDKMIRTIIGMGVGKIILTVSPVPMKVSFSGRDAIVANTMSKATLLTCAERLSRSFPEVDYFPAYEMVCSLGTAAFGDDNIHVRDDVVGLVIDHMARHYFPVPDAK